MKREGALQGEDDVRTDPLLAVFIAIISLLTVSLPVMATPLEERYVESRDRFTAQFKKSTAAGDEGPALAELERQMRAIIGPADIEGFPKQGTINLPTLRTDPDLDQIDGLRFDAKGESLVITTKSLLAHYLTHHPSLPRTMGELAKDGDFYRHVFHADAGVTPSVEIPVTGPGHLSLVHAFLGVSSQDIGPLIPRELFVLHARGNRIFIVTAPATAAVPPIPRCGDEWEQHDRKSATAYETYRTSGLTDKKSFDDYLRYREEGFQAFHRCFAEEAPKRPFFEVLTQQAQSIVDRLQRARVAHDNDRR